MTNTATANTLDSANAILRRAGPTATLLEWDDRIPSFDEVHAEALKAEKYIAAPALVNS